MSGIVWLCESCRMARGTELVKTDAQEFYVCPKCVPEPATVLDWPLAPVLDLNPRLRRAKRHRPNLEAS